MKMASKRMQEASRMVCNTAALESELRNSFHAAIFAVPAGLQG
jgi:hypothetical protein